MHPLGILTHADDGCLHVTGGVSPIGHPAHRIGSAPNLCSIQGLPVDSLNTGQCASSLSRQWVLLNLSSCAPNRFCHLALEYLPHGQMHWLRRQIVTL